MSAARSRRRNWRWRWNERLGGEALSVPARARSVGRMSANGFDIALAFAWRPENDGQPYHCDAHDSGGGTSWGVTEAAWAAAVAHGLVFGALRTASTGQLAQVLRVYYWRVVQGDALPSGIDQVVFDMAMVSGPARAARILQMVLGFSGADVDGDVGPMTLRAARAANARTLIERVTTGNEAFFGSLNAFTYFGRGWDRRAADCCAAALLRVASSS